MNIRRLPDLEGIGKHMGDLFLPEECQPNECIVRKGTLYNRDKHLTDCVMAFCKDLGILSVALITYNAGKWEMSKGKSTLDPIVKQALESVINQPCPSW